MTKMPMAEPTPELAEKLVFDTVARVERLAEMATRFPEPFKLVARQLPAWPVMRFKRATMKDAFGHVLYRLELGEDYPIEISHSARSHPSSAMGQYLIRWVERLHLFRRRRVWHNGGHRLGSGELKLLLELAARMSPLTKATSDNWSRQVLVPLIMLTDAGADVVSCKEPALQAIWRQSGVKSQATFKSRLLTKVRQTVSSLARPS